MTYSCALLSGAWRVRARGLLWWCARMLLRTSRQAARTQLAAALCGAARAGHAAGLAEAGLWSQLHLLLLLLLLLLLCYLPLRERAILITCTTAATAAPFCSHASHSCST